jgi:PhnB protein
MKALNVTLMFDGNTETVFNFYKSVFGGEFVNLQRFKDIPNGPPLPEEQKDLILYMGLPLAGDHAAGPAILGGVFRDAHGSVWDHVDAEL